MAQTDLVVVGGGLAGCAAAIRAAEKGLKVVLLEKREYPGREISACNHTFVGVSGEDEFNRVAPMWLERLFSMRANGMEEAIAADGQTRQWLIEELENHGVTVLYTAEAVGLTKDEVGVTGVLLATPLGIMHLEAGKVLDATDRLNLGRMISGTPYATGEVRVHAVFEMEDIAKDAATDYTVVEQELSLVEGSLRIHPTLRIDTQVIEYSYMDTAGEPFSARSELEVRRINKSGQVAAALRKHVAGFEKASASHHAFDSMLSGDEVEFPSLSGLKAITPLPWGFTLEQVTETWKEAEAIAQWVSTPASRGSGVKGTEQLVGKGFSYAWDRQALIPYEDDGLKLPLQQFPTGKLAASLPSFQVDICVAGSGAGGGMAMLAAAESGKRVAVIEVHTQMGGTHTVGRVTGYYGGYRSGKNQKVEQDAKAYIKPMGERSENGGIPHAAYLNKQAYDLGVQTFTASFACGAIKDGDKVTGVIAANEDGIFAIHADVTIDTTGNADVAAFAGAEYEIGDEETGMVQSYSLWGAELYPIAVHLMHRYLNDPGICHPDKYSERLRAIRDGHYQNTPYHITPMVTVRESRRIVGEHSLTVRDLLDHKLYDDVIAVAKTQADSHAYTSSPFARLGTLGAGQSMQVRIPYGCFVPKGVDGLLVAAKAISGERDATSFCRMNADIKNAGYAVGLAASMAIDQKTGVRDIDLPALQEMLKSLDILPDWAFEGTAPSDIDTLTEKVAEGDENALIALVRRPPEKTLPVLEQAYQSGKRGYVAHALAWFESSLGGDEIAGLLSKAVDENRHTSLPMLGAHRAMFRWGRDYGDDYTLVSRLIMFAGRSAHDAGIESLAKVTADTEGYGSLHPGVMLYDIQRDDMIRYPFFKRMLNIAYAAANRADKRLAPAMDKLLAREGVTGYATELGSRQRPSFMLAHAEISLARAAVRCGSELGVKVMESYLTDTHSFFRETARRELDLHAQQQKVAVLK